MAEKKKVLIIEDDEYLSGIYSTKFELEGFKVAQARDGEAGLKAVVKEMPDIIMLDILMPKINGFDLLKEIKKDKRVKHIPVVILSNLGTKEDIEKGIKRGAADYIIKVHMTPREIVQRAKEILNKK